MWRKNHLDGYNFLPYLTGQKEQGPRTEFGYFSDDGDLMALRYNNWKVHFMVQEPRTTSKPRIRLILFTRHLQP